MNKMTIQNALLVAFAVVFVPAACGQNTAAATGTNMPVVEEGKFRLHKFEQAIGWESYQVTKDGSGLAVKADFKFNDRGSDVPLKASFHGKSDMTPLSFEIKGKNSRLSTLDLAVEVDGGADSGEGSRGMERG